jgi:Tol biopolymer transport system component
MGEVYRAHDERLGRDVALKVLRREVNSDPGRQRLFAREARSASALNHTNIVTVYDVGMEGDVPYIVTEFVDGEPLSAPIARGPLPVRKALEIAIQVAAGLAAAHQAGIIHRDLKPANLMVTAEGAVKILDFGLAKSIQPNAGPASGLNGDTAPGFISGTATYMSPEQVQGAPLDHRTDQFSFGLVLYEMLTGKKAFSRASDMSTMAAIVEETARPIAELNPAIPVPVRWCVERCLEKDRAGRYVSTADLHRELQVIRARLEEASTSSSLAALPVQPPARKRRFWGPLLGATGLAAGFLATAGFLIPPAAVDLSAMHLRPVGGAGQYAASPAWSPSGKSVAFTAAVNGVRQVFVRDLSSPMSGQITNSNTDCERPFWLPDETRLYYFTAGVAEVSDLYSIGSTGGSPVLVERNISAASIAGDGRTLALLRADPSGQQPLSLWMHDSAGGEARRYTSRPFDSGRYQFGHIAFAPGGKQLGLWLSRWDGASEFWIVAFPEGRAREPFELPVEAYPFSWMPDHRHIVFGGAVPGSAGADLQMVDTKDGRMRPLTVQTRDAVEASAAPDGSRIAFIAASRDFDLLSVPLDGSSVQTLYGSGRSEFDPAWASNGDQLAYATDRSGTSEIWLRSFRDGWERPLVSAVDFGVSWISSLSEPNMSPDGRRLTYAVSLRSGHSIYMSSTTGGKPVRLSTETADESSPTWNTDGSWIAYLRNTGASWSLVKAPSGGGSSPTVLREGCLPSHPKWNRANGHWIACVTADGLTLISEDGKEVRPLSKDRWVIFGWSADGKMLHGVKQVGRRRIVSSIDIGTLKESPAGELQLPPGAEVRGFSLSPDGKSFATSASRPAGDIWILEGFAGLGLDPRNWGLSSLSPI